MKKLFFGALLLLGAVMTARAFTVVLRQADGETAYDSASVKSVAFTASGAVTVTMADLTAIEIAAADFQALNFNGYTDAIDNENVDTDTDITEPDNTDDDNTVGIVTVSVAHPFTFENGRVCAASGEIVEVYALDGRLVASGVGEAYIAELPSAVYIVRAGGKSLKMLLK